MEKRNPKKINNPEEGSYSYQGEGKRFQGAFDDFQEPERKSYPQRERLQRVRHAGPSGDASSKGGEAKFYSKKQDNESIVFGIRAVEEALRAGKEIEKLLVAKEVEKDKLDGIFDLARQKGVFPQWVPKEKLQRETSGNHQGVVAFLSPITYAKLSDVLEHCKNQLRTPLLILCDRITDVRNLGAIARSAEAAGADALIVPQTGSAQINAEAVKTSAGALMHLKVCREKDFFVTLKTLKEEGIKIYACTEDGDLEWYQAEMKSPTALLMGNEGEGITPKLLRLCDGLIKLPMLGKVGSLNVSVAAGIMLYETVRQRRQP